MDAGAEMSDIVGSILSFEKLNEYYEFYYDTGEASRLYILNSHVVRFYMSPTQRFREYPKPVHPKDTARIIAKNLDDYGLRTFIKSTLSDDDGMSYKVDTDKIQIVFDKATSGMTIIDKRTKKTVLSESQSLHYYAKKPTQTLEQHKDEHFFGGGMQNGRFAHKGQVISIANTNKWADGGVTSPCPFYWSSYGYGVLRNTWQPGVYDFGRKTPNAVKASHKGDDFDAYYFINPRPQDILADYYELTGQPLLLPEYAFYEGHFGAFNRDYWVEVNSDTPRAVLFEDGKYYKEYKPDQMADKTGTLESLNGEKNNYQFSARGMIDRYKRHDMPLGWFIPNDGYGCGYGQTSSLDGDIDNLKQFGDYARSHGVEVAVWTESKLEPVDPAHPKKGERDLGKEVGVAGVVALKCDVAWIGSGYSFGLTAVEDATKVFTSKAKHNIRPMIIMVDGWAGTHRYSGIWSGDQTGGQWEYIRFHIPTYIGSGLSGIPVIGSDMDGIYGGGSKEVNIRDYQWKTFTPLQLNMDGWGDKTKSPFTFDEEATDINRAYLKLKSMLMPYNYTIGREAIEGLPMIRAMFLEFPDESPAYTKISQYQFMWGPNILIAPVYNNDNVKSKPIRNGIYLPDENQIWIDFFTGQRYKGGKVINEFDCPLWKIPIFVRNGAIIPMVNPNNNPTEIHRDNRIFTLYPDADGEFEVYEDDGITSDYVDNKCAKTQVSIIGPGSSKQDKLYVYITRTSGNYEGMVMERSTLLQISASELPIDINMSIWGKNVSIEHANDEEDFKQRDNVYYFSSNFIMNPYLKRFDDGTMSQKFLLIKIQKIDIANDEIQLKINGYKNNVPIIGDTPKKISANKPSNLVQASITANAATLKWDVVKDAQYYEIDKDDVICTNIKGNTFTFNELNADTSYCFKVRAVLHNEVTKWSESVKIHTSLGTNSSEKIVEPVTVTRKISYEPCNDLIKVVSAKICSMLSRNVGPQKDRVITLIFDLGEVYDISKVGYTTPEDVTVPRFEYCFSVDTQRWFDHLSSSSTEEKATKTITDVPRTFRYMEIKFPDAEYDFDSGKHIVFYKNI